MFIRITEGVSVAPQIAPEDVALAAAQGFRCIVNNRPDGESFDQPPGAEIAAAAQAAGLDYVAIPIDHTGFNLDQVEAMTAAFAKGPLLAFCRSGTRSCNLWALAAAKHGSDPQAIIAAASQGGYNVAGLLPLLKQLAAR
ncbi:TIGR01244 family sulfur transferase [Sandarakinorhabdus sp. AAP62]|uniref:TIGR01244 family sulfur transferase n=1 Tax=Sandarakinorhabdus sp. AAP62 TaxID=1248916 RepID=UPI0003092F35|nr:TIGR01244 family sulfur transferase [Sandarakinorhabdus sp. AAP62]